MPSSLANMPTERRHLHCGDAASRPLFSVPSAARTAACSSVSVVNTPNATGIPVAVPTSMIPCETAAAMYSKCIVSPLITQPRQMMASKRPVSARRRAMTGISNAPGTRTSVMSSARTCADSSAARAPVSNPSVISALNLETMMAKRKPAAMIEPCSSMMSLVTAAADTAATR